MLPERTTLDELRLARQLRSEPFVVAAVADGLFIRGYLIHKGRNQIDYLKTLPDALSLGGPALSTLPVHETPELAVGVLICRDFQNNELREAVLSRMRTSSAPRKILCIPADMGSEWFSSTDSEIKTFLGIHLAVSNNSRQADQTRCPSLIANPNGSRIVTQSTYEPIYADVP